LSNPQTRRENNNKYKKGFRLELFSSVGEPEEKEILFGAAAVVLLPCLLTQADGIQSI
jgi:hypothetical protein